MRYMIEKIVDANTVERWAMIRELENNIKYYVHFLEDNIIELENPRYDIGGVIEGNLYISFSKIKKSPKNISRWKQQQSKDSMIIAYGQVIEVIDRYEIKCNIAELGEVDVETNSPIEVNVGDYIEINGLLELDIIGQ